MARTKGYNVRRFRPSVPYSVAAELLIPTETMEKGVPVKTFPATGIRINCNFRTFGGTEITENGLYSVVDTGTIETWYRPDLTAACRIKILSTGCIYEVVGTPENIEMRNQYLLFKVKAVKGGA